MNCNDVFAIPYIQTCNKFEKSAHFQQFSYVTDFLRLLSTDTSNVTRSAAIVSRPCYWRPIPEARDAVVGKPANSC